jgi:hypothetical protein
MTIRLPTLLLSRGGGRWPYMTGAVRQRFAVLKASLKVLPAQLPAPATRERRGVPWPP